MQADKIVLAYSGGLDTSVICRWLQDTYDAEVVTFTADIGQGEEVEPARAKAQAMGVREIHIEDLTETFVRDYVFPMFRANSLYEGEYLLGTSIARPLIARRLVEIAAETGADAIAHGATGKGNDQVRFELGAYALNPDIKVIAPWREWGLNSREALLEYCKKRQIPVDYEARANRRTPWMPTCCTSPTRAAASKIPGTNRMSACGAGPWLRKRHRTSPAPWRSTSPAADAVALDGEPMSPAALLARLNELGGAHGIGRQDLVENRYVGMKSRGCYERPAAPSC